MTGTLLALTYPMIRLTITTCLSLCLAILCLGAGQRTLPLRADQRLASSVRETLDREGEADVLILLHAPIDLSPAYRIKEKAARGTWVYDTLRSAALREQEAVVALLDAVGIPYQRHWLVNALQVRVDAKLVEDLLDLPEIKRILANNPTLILSPDPQPPLRETAITATPWGIERVSAPWAWARGYTGAGVVIGNQDTGYEWQHPALQRSFRGTGLYPDAVTFDYHWHDAVHEDIDGEIWNRCGYDLAVPCDDHGHGTHVVGTSVGNDLDPDDPNWPASAAHAIGVAPGARWIGCRNMDGGVGTPQTYIECFEWMVAPYPYGGDPLTDGDPTKAPDIMSNSWSCPPSEGCTFNILDVIEPAVNAADAAGIVVVTAASNDGDSCGSIAAPPAIYPRAYAVGNVNSADILHSKSSRGPVTYQGITYVKPDVSAPGTNILSSYLFDGYASFSGTSMATPHVAGVMALLIEAAPSLRGDTDLIKAIVKHTSDPVVNYTCGASPLGVPNNLYGYGIVNARRAIESLSAAGSLTGVVRSWDGEVYRGAMVFLHDRAGYPIAAALTDAEGRYHLQAPWGRYELRVRAGVVSEQIENVLVVGNTTLTQDVILSVDRTYLPMFRR